MKDFPITKIAQLFERDIAEVEAIYQEWLTRKRYRGRPISPDIKLLAALSGLSTASISNFLNKKHGSLSEGKRRRLSRLVDLTGYVPSKAAQNLRGQRRNCIGVVLPFSIVSPRFHLEIVKGIKQEATMLGIRLIIFDVSTVAERDEFFNKMPFLDTVDGLVAVSLHIDAARLRILERRLFPIVAFHNRFQAAPVTANILMVHEEAFQNLIDHHLIKHHGYRRLALVTLQTINPLKMGGDQRGDWNRVARIEAYEKALEINDIPLDTQLIFDVTEHSFAAGYEVFERILEINETLPSTQKIEAIVCTSDRLAAAILTRARQKGVEFAVTGFDNLPLAGLFDITTIDQKVKDQGRLVFRHLYNALAYLKREKRFPPTVEEGLDMKIVLRHSCGCLPKGVHL